MNLMRTLSFSIVVFAGGSTLSQAAQAPDACARLASLSAQRRELVQRLITARESTLHHISRELHDEFGQILTALGAMLGRAGNSESIVLLWW